MRYIIQIPQDGPEAPPPRSLITFLGVKTLLVWFSSHSTQPSSSKPASRTSAPKLALKCFLQYKLPGPRKAAGPHRPAPHLQWPASCLSYISLKNNSKVSQDDETTSPRTQIVSLWGRVSNAWADSGKPQHFLSKVPNFRGLSPNPGPRAECQAEIPVHAEGQGQGEARPSRRSAPSSTQICHLGKYPLSAERPGSGHSGCMTGHMGRGARKGQWAVPSS